MRSFVFYFFGLLISTPAFSQQDDGLWDNLNTETSTITEKTSKTHLEIQATNKDSKAKELAPSTAQKIESSDTLRVRGTSLDISRIGGSAHTIDRKELERFEYDDVGRILKKVPGVYVRDEDGFGLRPNIGMRGASSDRSAKITLMEDGILFTPAPYAAPAAYFFPLMTRMDGIDVFKGPAAIQFGPNTVGGAINLRTMAVPTHNLATIDLSYGQYDSAKLMPRIAFANERYGILLEGVHLETAGFKQLPALSYVPYDNTGFSKNEAMLKAHAIFYRSASFEHEATIKLTQSDELSNESYLGLSLSDFRNNPYARYGASQIDQMAYNRQQVVLSYELRSSDELKIKLDAYHQQISRQWEKVNHLGGAPDLHSLFTREASGQDQLYFEILRGAQDTDSNDPSQKIFIGPNDRRFISQGVQLNGSWFYAPKDFWLSQTFQFGARFHYDRIRRNHQERPYDMRQGRLVPSGDWIQTADNTASATAISFYLSDELNMSDRLFLTPGARVEMITTDYEDRLDQNNTNLGASTQVFLPGIGAFYAITPKFGILGGVHQGFSPVAPGQSVSVIPEKSVNSEFGMRYKSEIPKSRALQTVGGHSAELIGFWNAYSNLTGTCTESNGCDQRQLNQQFNGGEVRILGIEGSYNYSKAFGPWMTDLALNYTFTNAIFLTSLASDHPIYGHVEAGDEVPYVSPNQGSGTLSFAFKKTRLSNSLTFVDRMRDVAGSGPGSEYEMTDQQWIWDLALSQLIGNHTELYGRIDNVLGSKALASFRPFGARPIKPFQIMFGLKASLDF